MKACVLLRAESISSVITPKSQTGSILYCLWSGNLSTGYIYGFGVYTRDAAGQVTGQCAGSTGSINNLMHCPRFVRLSTVVGHWSSCLF